MKLLPITRSALLTAVGIGLFASTVSAVSITREFSASWYDPDHAGHGFNMEIVGSGSSKTMVTYWYTYDAAGNPTWIYATGPVVGDQAELTGYSAAGGAFGNGFDPSNIQVQAWGTLAVRFDDCNSGVVQFDPIDPALPNGTVPITRLTSLYNSSCSGGVSGDTNTSALAGEIIQFMTPIAAPSGSQAKLKFDERADRIEFSVELEDVPVGDYLVRVSAVERGTVTVVAVSGGTKGELEFRSPVEPGKVLLDFDPRGQQIEVFRGATRYFASTFGSSGSGTPPVVGNPPPFGNAVYTMSVEPSGNDGPELSAELEQRSDRVEFKVEAEDVPVGRYDLRVGGTVHGALEVTAVAGGTNGEVEFRNPVEPGKQPLDFDPRGELVELVSGGTVVLSGLFPSTPDGSASGGGTPPVTPSNTTFTINMTRSPADPDASGVVEYSAQSGEVEFEVEVEDVPDGNYTLVVAGVTRGTIVVDDERGKIRFRNPPRPDRIALDFDPRGKRIEVSRDGVLYLSADLP